MTRSSEINGMSHHFFMPITGVPHVSDSRAVSQNVSRNRDGMKRKSAFSYCFFSSVESIRPRYSTLEYFFASSTIFP